MAEQTIVVAARPLPRPVHSLPMSWLLYSLIACLVTDVTYWRTAEMMWADFSAWFVAIASVLAVLTLIAAIFDVATDRLTVPKASGWLVVIGYLAVLVLTVLNAMVHTRDAWTSVVPWGLTLSAVTVLVALVTCVWGRMVARREVA